MQGLSAIPSADAAAALGWLVLAGVDTPVDQSPRAWLAPVARPLDRPVDRKPVQAPATIAAAAKVATPAIGAAALSDAPTLAALTEAVAAFSHPLRRADLAPVLVTGNSLSGIVILCDQPEADDAPAARLRSRMLAAIGLDMGNCMLVHRLPWPTTGARAPRPDELAAFAPFVDRAFALAPPRAILALGQAAAAIAGEAMAVASARGRWAEVRISGSAVPLLATCHPRLLLSQPNRKREAWADLQAFAARLTEIQ